MDTYTVDQALLAAPREAGRRMRTAEEKVRIVQETLAPGISVAAVARRHGVNANLLLSCGDNTVKACWLSTRARRRPRSCYR